MTAFTSFFATAHSSAIFWISSDFDIMGFVPPEIESPRPPGSFFCPVSPDAWAIRGQLSAKTLTNPVNPPTIGRFRPSPIASPRLSYRTVAENLIKTDQKERDDPFGQRLESVFPLAEVFLQGGSRFKTRSATLYSTAV